MSAVLLQYVLFVADTEEIPGSASRWSNHQVSFEVSVW